MKSLHVCLLIAVLALTACGGNKRLPAERVVVKERAPAFCEYPHDLQESPEFDSLPIQEVRDLANRWVGDYCILHQQYRECLRLTTGGATLIDAPDYCALGD